MERSDVLWVGCLDYAKNTTGESDLAATLKRYSEDLIDIPKQALVDTDWNASLSID